MSRGRPKKYSWDTMDVGEHFLCSAKFSSARVMASTAGKKYGKKFKAYQVVVGQETDPISNAVNDIIEVWVERVG